MVDNREQWDAWREVEVNRFRLYDRNVSIDIDKEKHKYHNNSHEIGELFQWIMRLLNENEALSIELKQLKTEVIERKNKDLSLTGDKLNHIRLFMMTPFGPEYKPVEEAVRKVFEQKPFWFEVRLARDYYDAGTLVKNVQSHIASSHGFIAEISELSPNVMMEAGGVLMSGDERPLFAIRSRDGERPPVDFGDLLTFSYGNRTEGADAIADDIRKQIFTDGRLSNRALKELCEMRDAEKMKRFLSRSLLENLSDYYSLGKGDIEQICRRYSTVEEFAGADENALRALGTGSPVRLLKIAQEDILGQTEDSHGV